MHRILLNVICIGLLSTGLVNCSASSSSGSAATVNVETPATAVGSMFSGFGGSSNQSLSLNINSRYTLDPSMEICNSLGRGADK